MAFWPIRRLDKSHDRSRFSCGVPSLDEWLQRSAGQFDRKDFARTYVALQPDDSRVCGYYAICNHQVEFEELPANEAKGLPRLDIPVVLLGRLAVDREFQGRGLGAVLLVDALKRAANVSEQAGVRAVEVDAFDDAAMRFYMKFGFRQFLNSPRHLYMTMHEIRKLR